jgi:NAD(P)-dependent dehydrogenase (short-subunit alcohol dehydrogenase family)
VSRAAGALSGQVVVVIGGSAGIGLETARQARAEGARLILTARTAEPLERAARVLDALRTASSVSTWCWCFGSPAPLPARCDPEARFSSCGQQLLAR